LRSAIASARLGGDRHGLRDGRRWRQRFLSSGGESTPERWESSTLELARQGSEEHPSIATGKAAPHVGAQTTRRKSRISPAAGAGSFRRAVVAGSAGGLMTGSLEELEQATAELGRHRRPPEQARRRKRLAMDAPPRSSVASADVMAS
jgi:hypothetical protein